MITAVLDFTYLVTIIHSFVLSDREREKKSVW